MSAFTTRCDASRPQRTEGAPALAVPAQPEPRDRDVLCFEGEIDQLSVAETAERIFTRLEEAPGQLVLDLSAVSFLCVDGVRALVDAAHRAHELGIELRVFSAGARSVERALRAARLRHLIADSAPDSALDDARTER